MGDNAYPVVDQELSKVIWARCKALQGEAFGQTPVWIKNAVFTRDPVAGWLLDGDGTCDDPIRPAGEPVEGRTDAESSTPTIVEAGGEGGDPADRRNRTR